MTDNKKSGIALIAGALSGILVMATHPTAAHASLTPQLVEQLALGSAIVHSLAMAATLALLLGAIGLTRQLASSETSIDPDRLAFTGLVVFAFSVVAILLATSVSGFIIPSLWKRMFQDTAANAAQWQIAVTTVFQFNQTFAAIYSVAASTAIVLWSVSGLRHGSLLSVSSDAIVQDKPGDRAQPAGTGDPSSQALIYSARVSLDKTRMQVDDNIVDLTPGMAVTVEISTGSRTVLSYLLSPLSKYAHDSLRER